MYRQIRLLVEWDDRVLAFMEDAGLFEPLLMVAMATSSSSLISEITVRERSVPSECIKDCSLDQG